MNTYSKYCPNVFAAKCSEKHEKGEVIPVTTRHGKENDSIVFNLLYEKDGFYYYSIVRADGYNIQERAKAKAERYKKWAGSAEAKSKEYYKKSKKDSDFLSLGEPIKVGHHSERRHRKIIEQAWNNTDKWIENSDKAKAHEERSEYWESRTNDINLSMPESLEYYEYKLHAAKEHHAGLKDGTIERRHSYSLTYANKAVKEAQKNVELAVKLWGSDEERNQLAEEKRTEAEAKATKSSKQADLLQKYGGFFAFNNDQFREGYAKAVEAGHVEQGEKVTHVKAGLYIPSSNVDKYLGR